MSADRVDNAEAYEDGRGGDEIYRTVNLRKTVGDSDWKPLCGKPLDTRKKRDTITLSETKKNRY